MADRMPRGPSRGRQDPARHVQLRRREVPFGPDPDALKASDVVTVGEEKSSDESGRHALRSTGQVGGAGERGGRAMQTSGGRGAHVEYSALVDSDSDEAAVVESSDLEEDGEYASGPEVYDACVGSDSDEAAVVESSDDEDGGGKGQRQDDRAQSMEPGDSEDGKKNGSEGRGEKVPEGGIESEGGDEGTQEDQPCDGPLGYSLTFHDFASLAARAKSMYKPKVSDGEGQETKSMTTPWKKPLYVREGVMPCTEATWQRAQRRVVESNLCARFRHLLNGVGAKGNSAVLCTLSSLVYRALSDKGRMRELRALAKRRREQKAKGDLAVHEAHGQQGSVGVEGQ